MGKFCLKINSCYQIQNNLISNLDIYETIQFSTGNAYSKGLEVLFRKNMDYSLDGYLITLIETKLLFDDINNGVEFLER